MGMNWLHHTFRIHRIAAYIRTRIEDTVGTEKMGWEHYVNEHPMPIGRASYWGLRAAFVASSILAVGIALAMQKFDALTVVLLCVASVATILNFIMFYAWREPAPELFAPPRSGNTLRSRLRRIPPHVGQP
jgi:hypothetical protein